MIVKMIQVLGETMKKFQEMFTKDLEELKQTNKQTKKKQIDMKNTIGIKSRVTRA